MTKEEAVLRDALAQLGLANVTLWQLRCIESCAAALASDVVHPGVKRWGHFSARQVQILTALTRLERDLQLGESGTISDANWEAPKKDLMREHDVRMTRRPKLGGRAVLLGSSAFDFTHRSGV